MICSAVSNWSARDRWLTSPVWISSEALPLSAFTLSTASCSVPGVSAFGGFLKPIWLSLICMKVSALPYMVAAFAVPTSSLERGTPPATVHSAPVPAQSMHFRTPRRPAPAVSSLVSMSIPYGLLPIRRPWLRPVYSRPTEIFSGSTVTRRDGQVDGWHDEQGEQRADREPRSDDEAHVEARRRPRAGGNDQRDHAQYHRGRGHQDRAQPDASRRDDGLALRLAG